MSKKIHVAISPMTNTIFAGHVIQNGTMWGANKQDVTMEAILAVVMYALKQGGDIEISTESGVKAFQLSVKDLR